MDTEITLRACLRCGEDVATCACAGAPVRFRAHMASGRYMAAAQVLREGDSNFDALSRDETILVRHWLALRGLDLVPDNEHGWRVGRLERRQGT